MKFGIIKERKIPQDRRVVFSPNDLLSINTIYPTAEIKVESSDIRVFSDLQYTDLGINVVDKIDDCEVLFGVKEVPIENLIPNKKYFFFSHTIKKQAYNRKLLLAILEKNIELYDHETIVDEHFNRLIGFGRFAGIVGAYNAFRAFGIKFDLFNLPKAETMQDQNDLIIKLKRQTLPPIKIVLTGFGKVGMGAKEMLNGMKIKHVSVENFLTKNYSEAVFTQIDVLDYYKRIDGHPFERENLYNNPSQYISDFERFANAADILITGHFYGTGAPVILTQDMLKSKYCKLKVVADISCDVNGPIACTLRASTIADPFYGYHPSENTEVNYTHPAAIVVMAVDNLPCELPKDASQGFGQSFIKHVIPAFFNNDKDGILARAKVTENGKLTERFSYLQDFVDKEEL
jgi:alanine dehydrogenase